MSRSIEQFKKECKEKQSIIYKRIDCWQLLHSEQEKYGIEYKPNHGLISKSNLCPNCGNKLNTEWDVVGSKYIYSILKCQCGYEYAMKLSKQSMNEVYE